LSASAESVWNWFNDDSWLTSVAPTPIPAVSTNITTIAIRLCAVTCPTSRSKRLTAAPTDWSLLRRSRLLPLSY
jgi:hypothetical protein